MAKNLILWIIIAAVLLTVFSNFSEQNIAPKSESILKVIASPSIGIIQLLATKGWLKKGAVYQIKGTANFDGIVAPFQYKSAI